MMADLDSIYFAARQLSPGERPARLARACGDAGYFPAALYLN